MGDDFEMVFRTVNSLSIYLHGESLGRPGRFTDLPVAYDALLQLHLLVMNGSHMDPYSASAVRQQDVDHEV